MSTTIPRRPSSAAPTARGTVRRLRRGALVLVAGGALAAGAAGCGQAGEFGKGDPRSAVLQLLNASISQANGQRSCQLLTQAARTRLDDGPAGSCRQALNNSVSSMPGPFDSSADAGRATTDLIYDTISQTKDRAVVSARRKGERALTFDLVRLGTAAADQDETATKDTIGGSVDTDWRIDRGEKQLVEVDPQSDYDPPTTTTGTTPAPSSK